LIDRIEFRSFSRDRKGTFKIATGSSDKIENLFVKVICRDEFGIGGGAPSSVTNETISSMEAFVSKASPKLVGTDETDLVKLHQRMDALALGNTAAKAALDTAVLDLLSKREGKRLFEYLGGAKDRMTTDMTIGIETKEVTVAKAVMHCKEGFRALKLKVGLDIEDDVGRVSAVRDAVGPTVELRVDANQGYTVEQAVRFSEEMETLNVAFIEQPVEAENLEALRKVSERSRLPIMADECVCSSLEARRIAREGIADMINIKLMKCGGIQDARQIDFFAEAAGIDTMVGCMGEMQLPIAAALHFALSSENVKYADLDSHLSVVDDPTSGLTFKDGCLIPPRGAGIGIQTPPID